MDEDFNGNALGYTPPTIGGGMTARAAPVLGQSQREQATTPAPRQAPATTSPPVHQVLSGVLQTQQRAEQTAPMFLPAVREDAAKFENFAGQVAQAQAAQPAPQEQPAPASTGSLNGLGPAQLRATLTSRLMKDNGLSLEQAAGIVGNLSHETGGFRHQQEIAPTSGRGGYGFAQWTGQRRRDLEQFAAAAGKDPSDYDTQYAFLQHELTGKSRNAWSPGTGLAGLKEAGDMGSAASYFSSNFERAGVPNDRSRLRHAALVLNDYRKAFGSSQPSPMPAVQNLPYRPGSAQPQMDDLVYRPGRDQYALNDLVDRRAVNAFADRGF